MHAGMHAGMHGMRAGIVQLPVLAAALAACVTAGCASSPVGAVRFRNQPPVTAVNDRLDTPNPPRTLPFYRTYYHFNSYYLRAMRGLSLTRPRRAYAVNALDEVPDSTWFTNRVGKQALTPEDIRRGPGERQSPDLHLPWTVKSAKAGGASIGFVCVDSAGTKFVLKFDKRGEPEYETAADAIVSRLYWAVGYNVTSDHIVYFKRADLTIDPDATYKEHGDKLKLTAAYLDERLAHVNVGADGSIRGLASIYVEGKPVGGMPRLGVRADDPNDVIPHELRRDQRGQAALAAWLSVSDAKEDQTIDTYVEDPADPTRHYVKHYLIDFGKSLGVYPKVNKNPFVDRAYQLDPKEWGLSLITLGLRRQPWEGRIDPGVPGVGMYSAGDYRPDEWKPNPMAQFPIILTADRFDQFWGSKQLIQLSRAQIAAAVASARFTDSRSGAFLVEQIAQRQRITAKYWFDRVLPIDEPRVEIVDRAYRLCFADLAARHGFTSVPTTYRARAYDRAGRDLGAIAAARVAGPADDGRADRVCLPELPMARDGDRYTIYEVTGDRGIPGTSIHLAVDRTTGAPRVIGLHRR